MTSNVFKISTNEEYTDTAVSTTSDPSETVECTIKTGTTVEIAVLCLEKIRDYLLRRGST